MSRSFILVGNPNVGKTTIFNGLTGKNQKVGNWHGVTVGEKLTSLEWGENLSDLAGIYSLNTYSLEEKETKQKILSTQDSVIVNVVDCFYLERAFRLTYELLSLKQPLAIILNYYDEFIKQGGFIDLEKLEQRLGVRIFILDKPTKNTFERMKAFLQNENFKVGRCLDDSLKGIFFPPKEQNKRLVNLLVSGWFALPLFFTFMFALFYMAFGKYMIGEMLKGAIESFFCDYLIQNCQEKLSSLNVSQAFINLICQVFLQGGGSLIAFIPQIAILYFALIMLEESGVMSCLAFVSDGVFEKFNLSGRAVFSLLMGFGCTAGAILTTRGLENRQLQKRTIFILPYISCSAKLPVYLTIISSFFAQKFLIVILLYLCGIVLSLICALIKRNKYDESNFIIELARLRIPKFKQWSKPLLFYLKQYIIKIVTVVLGFLLLVWFFSNFNFKFEYTNGDASHSMLASFCQLFKYLFYPMGIKDWRVAMSAFSGLISKESIAGTLNVFFSEGIKEAITARSAIAFCVFILTSSPCINAVIVSAKEIGYKSSLLNAFTQTISAFVISYIVYFLCGLNILILILILISGVTLLLIYINKRE